MKTDEEKLKDKLEVIKFIVDPDVEFVSIIMDNRIKDVPYTHSLQDQDSFQKYVEAGCDYTIKFYRKPKEMKNEPDKYPNWTMPKFNVGDKVMYHSFDTIYKNEVYSIPLIVVERKYTKKNKWKYKMEGIKCWYSKNKLIKSHKDE
jgi:hypothetical protein